MGKVGALQTPKSSLLSAAPPRPSHCLACGQGQPVAGKKSDRLICIPQDILVRKEERTWKLVFGLYNTNLFSRYWRRVLGGGGGGGDIQKPKVITENKLCADGLKIRKTSLQGSFPNS